MKCTLMPGIKSISGSKKQKNGTRIVFKTFSKPSVNRSSETETRVYLMRRQERSTPLSENEIAARNRFSEAATYFKNLSEEQTQCGFYDYEIVDRVRKKRCAESFSVRHELNIIYLRNAAAPVNLCDFTDVEIFYVTTAVQLFNCHTLLLLIKEKCLKPERHSPRLLTSKNEYSTF